VNILSLNLWPYFIVWVVLAAVVLSLLAWRKSVASHEDDSLHLANAGAVASQVEVTHKLERIDKWGKILTAIAVVYGLAVGCAYLYQSWVQLSRTGLN